jgi:hypothetical protein
MENRPNDIRISWVRKNRVLVFILFWGFWALMVWSPWNDQVYTPKTTTSTFSDKNCKSVKYMSGEEMYRRARADGVDISLKVANEVAEEFNRLPDC